MKRYDLVHDDNHGEGAWIDEVPNGDYIRHDDADLAALVASLREVLDWCHNWDVPFAGQAAWEFAVAEAKRALAAAASGTTTRGGGE